MTLPGTTLRSRGVNPRLGTYFGIFTSAIAALVMTMLILEQLGYSEAVLRPAMLVIPVILVALVGLVARTADPLEFFAAGRRVPAVYTGTALALSALGGTGIVSLAGLMFLNGMDAWAVGTGLIAGFVVMGVLVAPFLRKFGGFTVPSYLGRRFESRPVAITAAALFAVPMLLVLSAEMAVALDAAHWLTGYPRALLALVMLAALAATLVLGGVRSLSWSQTAQAIIAFVALVVPASIIAIWAGNIPLPQFSYGPTLRAMSRLENWQGLPIPLPTPLALDYAGTDLTAIGQRFARPFGAAGRIAYILTSLVVMAGIAAAPWLAVRASATPTIYDSRKAAGWAVFFIGMALLTVSAIAVFLRYAVMEGISGHAPGSLPGWFTGLVASGHAGIPEGVAKVPLAGITWRRDAVLFSLPAAAGLPLALQYLSLIGAIAAALGAAAASTVALAAVVVEDGIAGSTVQPLPDATRLALARLAILAVAALGVTMAMILPIDPFRHFTWALSLSAATAFPVVVMSIWWKRMNEIGAFSALIAGFTVTSFAILLGEAQLIPFKGPLAGALGLPVAVATAFVVSSVTAPSSRAALELVIGIRIPGRETIYDREMRLQRLKRRQSGS